MSVEGERRQLCALGLGAMSAIAATRCAGIGWQWALLGGAGAGALFFLAAQLRAEAEGSLRTQACKALGRTAGSVVMALGGAFALLVLAEVTRGAAALFPESVHPEATGLILLALAAWAARRGDEIPLRCGGVLALVLFGLYALVVLAALGSIKLEWCASWGTAGQMEQCALLLCANGVWYLKRGGGQRVSTSAVGAPVLGLVPAALALVTAGNLSPRLAAAEGRPFYEMARGLEGVAVVERVEPLVLVAELLGDFMAMTLLLRMARGCFGGKARAWQIFALAALAGAGSGWADAIPKGWTAVGASVFWGILPIGIPLVVVRKKWRKKAK